PEMAKKYFGDQNPLDQVISFKFGYPQKHYDFKITGILKAIPSNSHLRFDWLASYNTLYKVMPADYLYDHWDSATLTYVELENNVDLSFFQLQLTTVAENHIDKGSYNRSNLKILPFNKLFFKPIKLSGYIFGGSGSLKGLMILMSILAFAILLIACFNYMNMATAKSITRAKEIGLKKVIGSNQKQIVAQLLSESIFLSLIAALPAIVMVELILPYYNQLTGLNLTVSYADNYLYLLAMMGICLFVGLFAGSYPAFVIASFSPVNIFRNQMGGNSPSGLRKFFIIFQLIITTIFIVVFLTVQRQINFLQTKELGFNKEHVLVLPIQDKMVKQKYDLIKHELLRNPNIIKITGSSQKIGTWSSTNGILLSKESIKELDYSIIYIDRDYVATMGLKLKSGRSFNPHIQSDQHAILLNESAYQLIQHTVSVGDQVELGWKSQGQYRKWRDTEVIGVLEDFHFRNLGMEIQPVIFMKEPRRIEYLFMRVNGNQVTETIQHLDNTLKALAPDQPFEYSFLDDDIQYEYQFIRTFKKILGIFLGLAISITCLGLVGLSSFILDRRTKEIGIRKVFGANSTSILYELYMGFVRLIIIANVIAWPIWITLSKIIMLCINNSLRQFRK
nr:hypothetical protein [candidate division KSB1 bacterium]